MKGGAQTCPFCRYPISGIIETTKATDHVTRRRHECLNCKKRFTTYEKIPPKLLTIYRKSARKIVTPH